MSLKQFGIWISTYLGIYLVLQTITKAIGDINITLEIDIVSLVFAIISYFGAGYILDKIDTE